MSANIEKARDIISNDIKGDIQDSSEMISLLSNEKKALETRDIETVQALSKRKIEITDEMTKRANKRSEILKIFGHSNDEPGVFALFEGTPRKEFEQSWLQLKDQLSQCQVANSVNSKVASRTKQSLQHILKIVQGKSDKPKVYNPLGSTSAIITGNLIGEA